MADSVIHNPRGEWRRRQHFVLVRPEESGNVGAVARALANFEMDGRFCIAGAPGIVTGESERWAMHAKPRLTQIEYFESLAAMRAEVDPERRAWWIGTSSRVGSARRPHPLPSTVAVERALGKLAAGDIEAVYWVFGAEGSGLTNAEMDACDAICFIPTSEHCDSLNLAQAVILFAYEVHRQLHELKPALVAERSQKAKLVQHLLRLAEDSGFILPGDPYKMKPRLESILELLPNHIPEAKTLHGWIDQLSRSVRDRGPDFKGRYRHRVLRPE